MYISDKPKQSYEQQHRMYKVEEGDTLQSVSKKLNIEPRVLRAYHNRYCEIPDLIEAEFPHKIKLVLLSPEQHDFKEEEGFSRSPFFGPKTTSPKMV